jgi:hypothetical protein
VKRLVMWAVIGVALYYLIDTYVAAALVDAWHALIRGSNR